MNLTNAMKHASDYESVSKEASEVSAELKEMKKVLIEFFEENPEVDRLGNVKCQRAPKKPTLSQKKMCELVEEEIMREPTLAGTPLFQNIAERIKTETDPGEVQIKITLVGKEKKSKQ